MIRQVNVIERRLRRSEIELATSIEFCKHIVEYTILLILYFWRTGTHTHS